MTDLNQTQEPRLEDLDPSAEVDVSQEPTQPDSMQIDSITEDAMPSATEVPTASEPKIPAKKDASLREFLGKMDDYAPIVCTAQICA